MSYTWNSFEVAYIITQTFVAFGTVFLSVFSAMVAYKSYKDNDVKNWLSLEFAYFADNLETGVSSLFMNLRDNGRIPLKISNAVIFFLNNNKILGSASFSAKDVQEIGMMDMKAVVMEPVKLRSNGGSVAIPFESEDWYSDKIKDIDLDKIKRIRIGVVSNIKYHKYDLSEEEVYYMIKYLKEFKDNKEKKK